MPGLFSEFFSTVQTEAEKIRWSSIKGGDMSHAWQVAIAYQRAEDATADLVPGATKGDVGTLILHYVAQGHDIPLMEVNASTINPPSEAPPGYVFIDPNYGRSDLLRKIIKRPADFKKVPPVIVTPLPGGNYKTVDGQNRSGIAKSFGPDTKIRAYVLPHSPKDVSDVATHTYRDELMQRCGASK